LCKMLKYDRIFFLVSTIIEYFAGLQLHWLIKILTAGLWMLFLLVAQTPCLWYMTVAWLELCMTGTLLILFNVILKAY
jgi:hypothetical protein